MSKQVRELLHAIQEHRMGDGFNVSFGERYVSGRYEPGHYEIFVRIQYGRLWRRLSMVRDNIDAGHWPVDHVLNWMDSVEQHLIELANEQKEERQ